ncbi:uncharacterized protein [Clytia hemisphaerica]|uniref:uncharacterized protein n=1 Tax=Clytia hemisphaerica TaxID=252671 RepID=UPI0034D543EF
MADGKAKRSIEYYPLMIHSTTPPSTKKKNKRLVLTPKRRSKKTQELVSRCILHHANSGASAQNLKLRKFSQNALDKVKNASEIRKDDKVIHLVRDLNLEISNELQFHNECYGIYTHSTTLKRIQKRYAEEETTSNDDDDDDDSNPLRRSNRKRDRCGRVLADVECCICYKKKCMKGGGYEPVTKCTTRQAAETLQRYALACDSNPNLRAYMSGLNWNSIVVPQEIHYHRTCYQSFTRPIVEAPKSPENEESLLAVINYVQSTVLDERELVTLDRLVEVYENALPRKGKKLHKRTLTDKVIAHFCGKVSMWSPKYGEAFLFNEEIEKGEIIEILFKKIEQAKEQKAPSLQTQIKNVGKLIKKNIKNLPDTYTSWPPNEDELISSKTHIPAELELFMTTVLTATPISRLSERKKAIISSLCEDVIYNSRAGRFRCSKQTKLGFCIKRKTGSKTLVGWMNKFGHCISYDDVNYLETILAMDAMYNESIRSFCPSLILPSIFVTFVWDNNDINPESIKGVSMHVTNGIVIQLKHESNNQTRRISQRLNTNRKRSFEAVENPLLKYNSTKKRDGPENKKLPKENESDLFRACELLNFFWAFLRAHSNLVPGWKGFNYLITPEPNDQVHNICYLPAINKSPTKMDAVLELLTQSKIKAEKLGLAETDVVLDQAIYAKACEILMNPVYKELKDFIVLRMGAFHAQCIFIAVIGKRFADAGLRDWIIEGDLIGSGSLEGVLNGKQYNYATRVLENVYDALSRFKVENFKEWIRERGKASENILERVISSSDFELCKEKVLFEFNQTCF